MRLRWSGDIWTWLEYFSVASLYGGGQSIRSVGTTLIVMPCNTRKYCPGETRSWTLEALSGVMKSPGFTCADAGVFEIATASTNAARVSRRQLPSPIARFMMISFSAKVCRHLELSPQQSRNNSKLAISPSRLNRQLKL